LDLKNIIVCSKCNTPHKKRKLLKNEIAKCQICENILYRPFPALKYILFSYSFSAFIFFVLANLYPIIHLDVAGYKGEFRILEAIFYIYNQGYVFLSLFTLFTIVIFPLALLILTFVFSFFVIIDFKRLAKKILIFITVLKEFVYIDIFFVAILVSLVKVFEYGEIMIDIGMISYVVVLLIFIYLYRYIDIYYYWEMVDV